MNQFFKRIIVGIFAALNFRIIDLGKVKLNLFKLFTFKRKLIILYPIDVIFDLHSRATVGKNDEKWVQNGDFLANEKSFKQVR